MGGGVVVVALHFPSSSKTDVVVVPVIAASSSASFSSSSLPSPSTDEAHANMAAEWARDSTGGSPKNRADSESSDRAEDDAAATDVIEDENGVPNANGR